MGCGPAGESTSRAPCQCPPPDVATDGRVGHHEQLASARFPITRSASTSARLTCSVAPSTCKASKTMILAVREQVRALSLQLRRRGRCPRVPVGTSRRPSPARPNYCSCASDNIAGRQRRALESRQRRHRGQVRDRAGLHRSRWTLLRAVLSLAQLGRGDRPGYRLVAQLSGAADPQPRLHAVGNGAGEWLPRGRLSRPGRVRLSSVARTGCSSGRVRPARTWRVYHSDGYVRDLQQQRQRALSDHPPGWRRHDAHLLRRSADNGDRARSGTHCSFEYDAR